MQHPKGPRARVPNPVDLYHNQVTREQGPFSLRMFHRRNARRDPTGRRIEPQTFVEQRA